MTRSCTRRTSIYSHPQTGRFHYYPSPCRFVCETDRKSTKLKFCTGNFPKCLFVEAENANVIVNFVAQHAANSLVVLKSAWRGLPVKKKWTLRQPSSRVHFESRWIYRRRLSLWSTGPGRGTRSNLMLKLAATRHSIVLLDHFRPWRSEHWPHFTLFHCNKTPHPPVSPVSPPLCAWLCQNSQSNPSGETSWSWTPPGALIFGAFLIRKA